MLTLELMTTQASTGMGIPGGTTRTMEGPFCTTATRATIASGFIRDTIQYHTKARAEDP